MAYEDDKRIYELQQAFSNFLTSSFAADKDGNTSAVRFTGQQILDFIQSNPVFPNALAGNTTPDNALGNNGDFYFRVPANGSALQMYQKINDIWSSVFNLPLVYKSTIEGDQDNVTLDNGYGKLITTLTQESIFVCTVTPEIGQAYKIPPTMLLGSTLFGFPNPTTTNFTFKITLI